LISRNQNVLWTELGGHVVLLSVEGGRYYETNAMGGAIWRLLEEPSSIPAVVDHVTTHYRVDRDRCSRDVVSFLGRLSDARLVFGVEPAPPHDEADLPGE
jgi:hypothetical protein